MNLKIFLVVILIALICLVMVIFMSKKNYFTNTGCEIKETIPESANSINTGDEETNNITISSDIHNISNVIEENEIYKITWEDDGYYCLFYDADHNIIKNEGPIFKLPRVETVDENCIKFTVQTGTGLSTQWGYYYHIGKQQFSETFEWIFDQADGKVAYAEADKVIVRDIFDKTKYYKEISNFSCNFSMVIEPIINVEFVEENSLKITYLSGDNYEEITELFKL